MADIDEDAPVSYLHAHSHDDIDPSDETQDFRLFASSISKAGHQIPKRGEKDFEPHGTKHQDGVLESSRLAMHDVLDYTRTHSSKAYVRGFYYGEGSLARDEVVDEAWRMGLDNDHIVVVESTKGPHFKTMGTSTLKKERTTMWLLPEEALYLVERGNLDLWWPSRSSFKGMYPEEADEEENWILPKEDAMDEEDEGLPMSLQAAYALLLGKDGERGRVTLERYTVYSNLKRNGYVVLRVPKDNHSEQTYPLVKECTSIFNLLFGGLFTKKEIESPRYGPLVNPGMYRSYHSIYRKMAIVPRHKPSPIPNESLPSPEDPFSVVYWLWKPARVPTFAKSNPGIPDFRVAIVDARGASVPSLTQMTSLLESTPWAPPKAEFVGPSKTCQRLKHGETAFGEEQMYERFDQGSGQGTLLHLCFAAFASAPSLSSSSSPSPSPSLNQKSSLGSLGFGQFYSTALRSDKLHQLITPANVSGPNVNGGDLQLVYVVEFQVVYKTSGSTNNTPLLEMSANTLGPIPAEGIVVDAPSIDLANSPAAMIGESPEDEDEDVVTPISKRKRTSVNYNLDADPHGVEHFTKRTKPSPKVRGVVIGVWRDSDQPEDEDKHVIHGFIDIHDRLRTRIYGMNRRGEELIGNLPMGAGGCWVTFPKVIFDDHLKSLNAAEIKEYVKLRAVDRPQVTDEERREADMQTVMKAIKNAASQDNSPVSSKPVVPRKSLGRQSLSVRPAAPRQSLSNTPGFNAVNAANIQTPKSSPFSEPKQQNGVILGYWSESDQIREADKHAVFGVLGGTDSFRVKVQRVTRDGRFVDGNFPTGAGALWLHYDKLVLEPHLVALTRPEVKEYVRIRMRDMENGEVESERKANEMRAVRDAKAAVASDVANGKAIQAEPSPEPEIRHSARSEMRNAARVQAAAEAEAEKARQEKMEARERQHEQSRKEVALAESVAQAELKNNLKKLNKVWIAQQAATGQNGSGSGSGSNAGNEEVKYYHGIKYERKLHGPLQGKLVSAAQLLTIDGEDYVEYRVLTKPSF
ncbi:hypothetical protein B7494_g5965 [Chlorociboria aeruginascens]|nr:hypothetical protein B7494_g5965 [Chlorociboria aeruginascens]